MHIAISFPMDTVRNTFGKPDTMFGRAVANHSFLLGLAEAGVDHRVTLFVPSLADIEMLRSTLLAETRADIRVVTRLGIASFLEENPIDVLHFMDPEMAMGGQIRNLLTDQDFVVTGVTHSLGKPVMDALLLNNANGIDPGDCLICTTPAARSVIESMATRLGDSHPEFVTPQTEVIPLGMDLAQFRQPTMLARQDLGLAADDFVILSLSRFTPLSKMDILPVLNLLSMIRQKSTCNVRLVLAGSKGEGPYLEFLRDWVGKKGFEDSVQFVVGPADEQKIALYQVADVFLSLSDNLQETFGLTVIEALASGLPAVVSDWDGYKSLVEHEVTGFLVPTKMLPSDQGFEASLNLHPSNLAHLYCAQTTAVDLPAARDAILRLEADREGLQRMSRAAATSVEIYDWNRVIPRYFTLWDRLCERKSAAGAGETERNRRTGSVRFFHDFVSYPTTVLSPDDRFVSSEVGQLVLHGKESIHPYGEMREMLDLQLMTKILQFCCQPRSVRELLSIGPPPGDRPDPLAIQRNLMWLYKYGYVAAE